MGWIEDQKKSIAKSKEVLAAYGRQGLHELGSAFYGAGTVAQHPEYGMLGTKTPGEVADGLRTQDPPSVSRDAPSPSVVDQQIEHAKQRAAQEPAHEKDDRQHERE